LWPEQGQDNQSSIIAATALKRSGTPADVAAMVAFLALEAPYVTGQIVAVDGGRSLGFQGA
jgi:pteridine reductase